MDGHGPQRLAAALAAALLLAAAPAAAQSSAASGRTFTMMPGVTTQRLGGTEGWALGPTLAMNRRFGPRFSLDIVPSVFLTSSGFYTASGIALDLGPAYAVRGPAYAVSFGVGSSFGVVGNSDGSAGAWAGGYVSTQGTYWFNARIGVTGRGAVRYLSGGQFSPGVSAGVSFGL